MLLHVSVSPPVVIIQRVNVFFIIIVVLWIVLVDLKRHMIFFLWCLGHAIATTRGIPTMVVVPVLLSCVIEAVGLVRRISMGALLLGSMDILLSTHIML